MNLKPCPCGTTPDNLNISHGSDGSHSYVFGDCCGCWEIEFKSNHNRRDYAAIRRLAIEAWNEAPRNTEGQG